MGQQKMEGTGTVTRREPVDLRAIPSGSVVHFEREIVGKGMWSAQSDRLTETGPQTTLWVSESEYRFSGLLMRLVGFLMPGAFRKQSLIGVYRPDRAGKPCSAVVKLDARQEPC
jgi:hypothetical protein